MMKNLLILLFVVIVSGAYAQKDIMADYNGNFEQGTPALSSVFRDALVDADGYQDVIGDQQITDDPYEGDSAMYTIWVAPYEGLAELVLDTWSTGIPVKAGSSYTFKLAAYKIAGPDAVLHSTVGFFDAEGIVLYEESGNFTLGDFYEEFAQAAVVAPEGAVTCWVGFRMFGPEGARWPADEVEAMIDEMQLIETGPSTDIMASYNGNFEQGTPVLSSVFRDALVDADGYQDVIGDQQITDDPYEGDSAMYTVWVAPYEGLAELVLDTWSTGIPVKAGASYVFKFAAYKIAGSDAVLHSTVGFFDAEGIVLYEESGNFTLGDFYEEFAQAAVVAPEGAVTCWVGFRMFGPEGARWPADEVEAMIDEMKLLETGGDDTPPAEENYFVDGGFENPNGFADWRTIEIYFNDEGGVTGVGDIKSDETNCTIAYSDNANNGDNAAEIFWAAPYRDDYQDALIDQNIILANNGINPGDTLIFEASAMNVNGPDMILQMRHSFFKNDWSNMVDTEDNNWVLNQSTSYSTYKTQVIVPEDDDFVLIGFRPRDTDGSSFIFDDLTILLDDVKLYHGSLPSTAIDERMDMHEVRIYPNPVLDQLQVQSETNITSVSISNILGHEVMLQRGDNSNTMQIDFSALPVGMYLVRINSEDGIVTKKVLKN